MGIYPDAWFTLNHAIRRNEKPIEKKEKDGKIVYVFSDVNVPYNMVQYMWRLVTISKNKEMMKSMEWFTPY